MFVGLSRYVYRGMNLCSWPNEHRLDGKRHCLELFCCLRSLHVLFPGVCKCSLGESAKASACACFLRHYKSTTLAEPIGVRWQEPNYLLDIGQLPLFTARIAYNIGHYAHRLLPNEVEVLNFRAADVSAKYREKHRKQGLVHVFWGLREQNLDAFCPFLVGT